MIRKKPDIIITVEIDLVLKDLTFAFSYSSALGA